MNPTPKCATCGMDIQKKTLNALGKTYHPDHFLCHKCKKPIQEEQFQAHEENPYCGDCYSSDFLKKCHVCKEPIKEGVISALGQNFHPEHFLCGLCKTKLMDCSFVERDGKAVCQDCFESNFVDKCKSCGKPVCEKTIIALDSKWHPDCFRCNKCQKPITEDSFQVENGFPICIRCS